MDSIPFEGKKKELSKEGINLPSGEKKEEELKNGR